MQNSDYIPISCSFHDRLEDYSIRGATIPIMYGENDRIIRVVARIEDVFARDGADYAKLISTEGTEVLVRLDRLLAVNGFKMPIAC